MGSACRTRLRSHRRKVRAVVVFARGSTFGYGAARVRQKPAIGVVTLTVNRPSSRNARAYAGKCTGGYPANDMTASASPPGFARASR
jgi:hypothetical protein